MPEREGHQLAVVAYRDGQLHFHRTRKRTRQRRRKRRQRRSREEGEGEGDRGKSYNLHTDGGKNFEIEILRFPGRIGVFGTSYSDSS